MQHRGRAIVFEDIDHFKEGQRPGPRCRAERRVGAEELRPKGTGFPEVGNLELPPKILAQGITDMVRISDARMSGTAYGTVVLHTSPEAAAGGTLALVQDGDMIELDVAGRRLHLDVSDDELERRRNEWSPRPDRSTAATTGSITTTCCRPTPAPTWISSLEIQAPRSRREPLVPQIWDHVFSKTLDDSHDLLLRRATRMGVAQAQQEIIAAGDLAPALEF